MPRGSIDIDRDKLRAAVRKLGDEYVFYMLYDAIDVLSPSKLNKIVRKYFDLKRLAPDSDKATNGRLLAKLKAFEKASLTGEYYESFDVNSKNSTKKADGTKGWISECRRFLDCCVKEAMTGDPVEVREAFDIIFGLLDSIDECRDDIIFFADVAGSWQVGVDWEKVLPPWFRVLSATAEPEEYAERTVYVVKQHYEYGRRIEGFEPTGALMSVDEGIRSRDGRRLRQRGDSRAARHQGRARPRAFRLESGAV
jgi:hypothetical protein